MAGLRVNPFANSGVQAAGFVPPIAKANPFAPYNRQSLEDVRGNGTPVINAGDNISTLGFGGYKPSQPSFVAMC